MAAIAHRNNFCRLYQRNKSASIVKFRQASNLWKRVLEAAKLAYATVAQKMKFSIKVLFSKCDQIRRKLRIWSHLLKKSLTENFIFCAV